MLSIVFSFFTPVRTNVLMLFSSAVLSAESAHYLLLQFHFPFYHAHFHGQHTLCWVRFLFALQLLHLCMKYCTLASRTAQCKCDESHTSSSLIEEVQISFLFFFFFSFMCLQFYPLRREINSNHWALHSNESDRKPALRRCLHQPNKCTTTITWLLFTWWQKSTVPRMHISVDSLYTVTTTQLGS